MVNYHNLGNLRNISPLGLTKKKDQEARAPSETWTRDLPSSRRTLYLLSWRRCLLPNSRTYTAASAVPGPIWGGRARCYFALSGLNISDFRVWFYVVSTSSENFIIIRVKIWENALNWPDGQMAITHNLPLPMFKPRNIDYNLGSPIWAISTSPTLWHGSQVKS